MRKFSELLANEFRTIIYRNMQLTNRFGILVKKGQIFTVNKGEIRIYDLCYNLKL
jgi:hypothetical protein